VEVAARACSPCRHLEGPAPPPLVHPKGLCLPARAPVHPSRAQFSGRQVSAASGCQRCGRVETTHRIASQHTSGGFQPCPRSWFIISSADAMASCSRAFTNESTNKRLLPLSSGSVCWLHEKNPPDRYSRSQRQCLTQLLLHPPARQPPSPPSRYLPTLRGRSDQPGRCAHCCRDNRPPQCKTETDRQRERQQLEDCSLYGRAPLAADHVVWVVKVLEPRTYHPAELVLQHGLLRPVRAREVEHLLLQAQAGRGGYRHSAEVSPSLIIAAG
jgi:hypothetical protein